MAIDAVAATLQLDSETLIPERHPTFRDYVKN